MSSKTFLVSLAIAILAACTNGDKDEHADKTNSSKDTIANKGISIDSNVIKVYIDLTGNITANGILTTLPALDSSFSKLKSTRGTVYYSRDETYQVPPPGAMKVMELIRKYELLVLLYSDKTFTKQADFD